MAIRKGSWHIRSKSNKKWNKDGRGLVGGFIMPAGCKKALEKLKKKYGEPPEDLTWGYFKD